MPTSAQRYCSAQNSGAQPCRARRHQRHKDGQRDPGPDGLGDQPRDDHRQRRAQRRGAARLPDDAVAVRTEDQDFMGCQGREHRQSPREGQRQGRTDPAPAHLRQPPVWLMWRVT